MQQRPGAVMPAGCTDKCAQSGAPHIIVSRASLLYSVMPLHRHGALSKKSAGGKFCVRFAALDEHVFLINWRNCFG
jgi:hypothetical protein